MRAQWECEGESRKEGNSSEEETDLCKNILAAQRQCPHVRKVGLHFMDKSSSIMQRKPWDGLTIGANASSGSINSYRDLNKFVWDLAEYEKRLLNVVL